MARRWSHRLQTSPFPKICSRLSFLEIACRTWKNGKLMMARTGGFKIVRIKTERPGLGESGRPTLIVNERPLCPLLARKGTVRSRPPSERTAGP